MEARTRPEGFKHLSLTVNILWQIWKSRNNTEFKGKLQMPWKVIHTAQEEWMEFEELRCKTTTMSTEETAQLPIYHQTNEDSEAVQIRIAVHRLERNWRLGIGVVITNPTAQHKEGWAMRERCTDNQLLDKVNAIKLTLSKAAMKGWRNIAVGVQDQDAFNIIRGQKLKDIRMATLVDDIKHLRLLFQKCSFCLVDNDVCHVSSGIGKYALGILQDEEVQIPQCSNALLV